MSTNETLRHGDDVRTEDGEEYRVHKVDEDDGTFTGLDLHAGARVKTVDLDKIEEVIPRDERRPDNSEPAEPGVDVEGFREYYEQKAERGDRSEWTADAYIRSISKFNDWYEQERDPERPPQADDVRAWCEHLAMEEDLAGSTIQRHFHGLKAYFKWQDRKSEIVDLGDDIADDYPDRSGGTPDYFDWDEIEALREACETPFEQTIVQLLSGFGMRIGELMALDTADIDFDAAALHVERQKRTNTWVDAMYMTSRDVEVLRDWLDARVDALPEDAASEALFVTANYTDADSSHPAATAGYRASATHIRETLNTVADRAGIDADQMRPHKFRHSVGTRLKSQGYDTFDVKQYLGHSRSDVTETYMALTPEQTQEMREDIG